MSSINQSEPTEKTIKAQLVVIECPCCHGWGQFGGFPCPDCHGEGTITIRIPEVQK